MLLELIGFEGAVILKQEELEAVIQYLVNRVKELKRDTRKLKGELDDAFKMISELADAKRNIVERQDELKARLTKLEANKK